MPLGVPVSRLSVAHQQLTEIGKALGRESRVLVMDEPTARLAHAEREALFRVIRDLADRGVAIVYISHFLDEVLEICDSVTILRDGAVVASRPAGELDVEGLARHIVGEAAADRPPRERAASTPGPVVLELDGFGQVGRPTNTLALRAGSVLGLAGLVGSGRSSLLESVCGGRPARGTLRLHGRRVRLGSPATAARAGVVLVPEDRKHKGLVLVRPVSENLVLTALGTRYTRAGLVRWAPRARGVRDAIARFGIRTPGTEVPAGSLSGGNQQKVLLARAAEAQPVVLLLDQPTAGVDIGAKEEIYAQVRALAATGVACIVASDELEELLALCDELAVVRAGRVSDPQPAAELDEQSLLARMSAKEAVA